MTLFKSKTFLAGLASALTGAVLTITGNPAIGAPLMITGLTTMLGRRATEIKTDDLKKKVAELNEIIQQLPVDNSINKNLPN